MEFLRSGHLRVALFWKGENEKRSMLFRIYSFVQRMKVETVKPFGKNIGKEELKISICDTNKDIAKVFSEIFAKEERVEISCGNILNLTASALISPANSFGDMGGGLDKAIDDFYEGEAQKKVQQHIQQDFFGELPVGVASILKMNYLQFPFLIVAPTMRIPGNVGKTINAYLAMRAILVAVLKYNDATSEKINHIALPSLCTGVGGMPFLEAGEQMSTAISTILNGDYKKVVHPAIAPYVLGAKWVLPDKLNRFREK
jgi:O-acetyl-ADP-ribose deacetylase (regulator of RNase III)